MSVAVRISDPLASEKKRLLIALGVHENFYRDLKKSVL